MPQSCLITGATGFVGGHLAEACGERRMDVRTIARPNSDTTRLEKLGVMIHRGDLTDRATVRQAVQDVDLIVHCAAKVGDWGPVDEYRAVNVEGLRHLLDACKGSMLQRFVHVSSLGVYVARHHYGTDESENLPDQHVDGYTQSKVESERLALRYYREFEVPVVVLRPGFIYGPRDRTVMPQVIENLRQGKIRYLGGGKGALNTIYVGNLVEAILLALDHPDALGKVFNLTDGEVVSKRRFLDAVADGLNLPRPPNSPVPVWLARVLASFLEKRARKKGFKEPPMLTQARVKFLGLNLDFSIDKARRELGYKPSTPFDDAIRRTMAWYRENA
ncbi:MAG: NAD-dependent epimerase/dehydratase family protein [Gemmataceae bacterium]